MNLTTTTVAAKALAQHTQEVDIINRFQYSPKHTPYMRDLETSEPSILRVPTETNAPVEERIDKAFQGKGHDDPPRKSLF